MPKYPYHGLPLTERRVERPTRSPSCAVQRRPRQQALPDVSPTCACRYKLEGESDSASNTCGLSSSSRSSFSGRPGWARGCRSQLWSLHPSERVLGCLRKVRGTPAPRRPGHLRNGPVRIPFKLPTPRSAPLAARFTHRAYPPVTQYRPLSSASSSARSWRRTARCRPICSTGTRQRTGGRRSTGEGLRGHTSWCWPLLACWAPNSTGAPDSTGLPMRVCGREAVLSSWTGDGAHDP
ncbi:unnamed protein product [Mycena citricolor]|uniref:Uncharacterized protein n=1 Tax=Mycena citricolor TaxID=2018698 RepID=A0AAD2HPB5_9AGAR|nr:unnamed protein product [Mycena citricolor]